MTGSEDRLLPQRDNLRIAIFSDSLLPVLNGVSISIDTLVKALRDRGHSVHLFGPGHPGAPEEDPNVHRFRSVQTPWTKGYPIAIPPFYGELQRFRRHRFDLIHTHTPWVVGFVGLRWAESHEIPIVSTYHTLYDRYAHYFPILPRRYIRFRIAKQTNFYYNSVAHVITPTDASLKWLRRHSVKTPATVIPTAGAAPVPIDRSEARLTLDLRPNQRALLYVGRLAKEKNLQTLIKATAFALRKDPQLRLLVVGDGPFREDLRTYARSLGIGDKVRFVGFVPRNQVDRFYAAADLFVFPSFTETQGLVIEEAMNYGLPTVAIVGGGASEAIDPGVNGLVVSNAAEELAEAIGLYFGDSELQERLTNAASHSGRRFSVDDMCDRVLGVYHSVLADHDREHLSASASVERPDLR